MSAQPLAQTRARRQVSALSCLSTIRRRCTLALHRLAAFAPNRRKPAGTVLPPPSLPPRPASGSSILTSQEGSLTTREHGRHWIGDEFNEETNRYRRHVVSIDFLPDDVLLEVFYFYVHEARWIEEAWKSLVHVCRRWRTVVFGSPTRLDLHLFCTAKTPAKEMLEIWPALPLRIRDGSGLEKGLDNIIAVLERSDRVRRINLWRTSSSDLESLSAAMEVPFPELTDLQLFSYGEVVLPDSFLGGSAPCLQNLELYGIPFPGLPKLLLSVTHLIRLNLEKIPHSGYISPEAMASALSTLTSLEDLKLEFKSPQSRPDRESRRPPSPTCSVLSVLTLFMFKGDNEYFEDLVSHIDAPRLYNLRVVFFNQIVFDTPQLIQFICRTPRLKPLEEARVIFDDDAARVELLPLKYKFGVPLRVEISCRELDWQISSMEQVCTSSLPPLSTLESLYINDGPSSRAHWQDNIDNSLWLELLHPFRSVKNLYLSKKLARYVVPSLQQLVGRRATEVLPTLQNIFLEGLQPLGPLREGIMQFVAARHTGDPITVSIWDRY